MKAIKNSICKSVFFYSLVLLSLTSTCVFARSIPQKKAADTDSSPWFTGPLLAGAGHTIPAGHLNIEPYMFVTDSFGFFHSFTETSAIPDVWTFAPSLVFSYGLNDWIDFQGVVSYTANDEKNDPTSPRMLAEGPGDTSAVFGFQILTDKPHTYIPDLRVTIGETFPTGFYSNLSTVKLGAEATGSGSYQTTVGLNFQKLRQLLDERYLRTRLMLTYTIGTAAHLQGINAYGGAINTNGTMHIGNKFFADLAFEYTWTRNWVPAIDITFSQNQKGVFHGFSGTNALGMPVSLGYPSGEVVTLAPALEYNFSSKVGVIGGAWFTVAGQNKLEFASAVVALNLYY